MNADPRVMEFMPGCLEAPESDRLVDRIGRHFAVYGFGLYAVELRADHTFAGYIGLSVPDFDAPFMPAIEIGWRLAFEHWGKGFATEGAREVIRHAFETLGLKELVSFTAPSNLRSIRVMQKLGMTHEAIDDFEHPNLNPGHRLRPHVLYRLART
jgi:RimJ/RimL family protein N-acetyltransferase